MLSTITIFRGIARRDELLRRAQAGETLLAATLEGIADGVIVTDAKGRITFINPVAQKLTGWSDAEAKGVPINRVFQIVNETTRAGSTFFVALPAVEEEVGKPTAAAG